MKKRASLLAMVVLFTGSLVLVNPYVRGDGNGYYAWLTSAVIDHDLDFTNQFAHGDALFKPLIFDADGRVRPEARTRTGRVGDQWSIGPALLWAPWFLTAHLAVSIARALGAHIAADGYSWPYLFACAVGTVCYGWLGLWLSRGAAVAFGYARSATAATIAMWAASSLPVYQYFLPFHVHALAAFSVALFVWWWARHRPFVALRAWAWWGATAGLMSLVYQVNAVVVVIAAYELVVLYRRTSSLRSAARAAAVFAVAALVVFIPQLAGKAMVYGTPLTTGYGDEFFWTTPRLWLTGWSTEHGLFLWTPIAIVGVIGLVMAARSRPPLVAGVAACALFYYVVASYQNWHGQSSFGNRFFLSLMAFFVIGAAAVWERMAAARVSLRIAMAGGVVLLVLWNAGLAFQWGTGMIPTRGPVDFAVVGRQQLQVPVAVVRFAFRYVSARAAMLREIEQRDATERGKYELKR